MTDSPLEDQNLDGHTIEELSDYLDRGRTPPDPSIESSPGAQNALAALSRLRAIAPRILEAEANAAPERDESWIKRILDQIGVQAHAGRDIPISYDRTTARLSISEGAVRALVRQAGDEMDGLIVERCVLDGDVEHADEPVVVTVRISVLTDADEKTLVPDFRSRVMRSLSLHTQLNVAEVIVRVRDADLDDEDDAKVEK